LSGTKPEEIMKNSQTDPTSERRQFLRIAAGAGGLVLVGCAKTGATRAGHAESSGRANAEAEVTPGEDLMQEHGAIERILLIYDEAAHRIEVGQELDLRVLASAAGIVRRFVEGYHEKLEEQFVFPRLQAAHRETDLVATLLEQHERGRQLTEDVIRRSGGAASPELAQVLRAFVRMYRPHAAREDTVLFPAFRDIVGRSAYRELGEQFEDKEHELFGENGFQNNISEIARLETALGIGDLARFTAP
jgi:hemerythrin-like domain-containing protein